MVATLLTGYTNAQSHADSTQVKYHSAKDYIEKSNWHFHSRSFYMQTINQGHLKDDYALAQGAGIGLVTAPIKGFQLGVSGYFIFKVFSSNIDQPDPTTKLSNRYEIGQFDITNHTNHHDLDRLEDLYLKYSYKQNNITVGRMELETPFLNMQDGRMRPTIEEGVWLNLKPHAKLEISGGYIWGVSPRSTVNWYKMDESLGIYPMGVNPNGTKSNYKNNISSDGVLLGNINYKLFKNTEIKVWNMLFENVSNTTLLELRNETPINKNKTYLYQNMMFIKQYAVNNGGSAVENNTYFTKNAQSEVISTQLGLKNKKYNWNVNYTHITATGRYLMPREWGRDPFYTFMPRERNEGMGNVHAISSNLNYFWHKNKIKTGLGYGYYSMPSASNSKLNKYSMPSYQQINISSAYSFANFWKGLELKLLVAYKFELDNEVLIEKYIYNKVNMVNFNLIVDIKL